MMSASSQYRLPWLMPICLCMGLSLGGCAQSNDESGVDQEVLPMDTITFSKADIYELQNRDDAVHPLIWRDAARCAAGLGGGAWEGATDLLDTLWHLPGMVANLAVKVGRELARREADYMLALSNEEARQRVRETASQDLQRIRGVFATIRGAIPTLWGALETGTDWFGELDRDEKVFLVCRITGRLAFEIIAVIAADKGLSALSKLGRLRLIQNVNRHAMSLSKVTSWLAATRRTTIAVGIEIAGRRRSVTEDPRPDFDPLGTLNDYGEHGREDADLSSPALGWVKEGSDQVELLSNEAAWESTPTYGWVDMLLPAHQTPPARSVPLEEGVSAELAEAAARWADPDTDAWDERALELTRRGADFRRYLVPAEWVKVSLLNPLLMTISSQIEQLSERLGEDLYDALDQASEYVDRSPREKTAFLDEVFAELASSEMP